MRETTQLPVDLHEASIVLAGAIIVFDEQGRRAASYVPGTIWVGSLMLPEEFSLDNLPNTLLEPRANLTVDAAITACQRLTLWQAITNSNNSHTRILAALDALGEFTGYQQELAHVCGMSREYLLRYLRDLVNAGQVIRVRSHDVARAHTLSLAAHERGLHWRHSPRKRFVNPRSSNAAPLVKLARPPTAKLNKSTDKSPSKPVQAKPRVFQTSLFDDLNIDPQPFLPTSQSTSKSL